MRIKRRSLSRQKQEKRITRMVCLMILAFNISWTPYAFVCTLKLLHHNFVSDTWAVPGLLLAKRYLERIFVESIHVIVFLLSFNIFD